MSHSDAPLLTVLNGEPCSPPPLWLMRQAGRYLPEYREVRKTVPSFLDLCLTPKLAAEVTLQPLRRFDFDASIVFSDILIVPFALGQPVAFLEGEGPKLDPIGDAEGLARLDPAKAGEKLSPVYETVERVVAELPHRVPLIGFCGAPWTVATYMVEGAGSKDQAGARALAYSDPSLFQALIDLLVETSTAYLLGQVKAGCRALQIFDSWSGSLPEDAFAQWCIAPTKEIVARVKREAPGIPVIGFPRGAGPSAVRYAGETGVDAWDATRACPWTGSGPSCRRWCRCRAISIRCCWLPADRPWTRGCGGSWRSSPPVRSSSTWDMAFYPRRRSSMWSGWCA